MSLDAMAWNFKLTVTKVVFLSVNEASLSEINWLRVNHMKSTKDNSLKWHKVVLRFDNWQKYQCLTPFWNPWSKENLIQYILSGNKNVYGCFTKRKKASCLPNQKPFCLLLSFMNYACSWITVVEEMRLVAIQNVPQMLFRKTVSDHGIQDH